MTNHTLSPTRASEYDDNEIVNLTANAHMDDILVVRLSRRSALKGGVSVTAGALLGGLGLSACGGDDDPAPDAPKALALGFTAVAKNLNDLVTVPEGYQVSILHALGDPLHYGDESWKDDGSESAESYNRRMGDGHDGMYFFGLTEDGKYDAARSDRGLLAVNHEYVVQPYGLHPAGITAGAKRVAGEVEKEIYAHGASVVEVKRGTGNDMEHGARLALQPPCHLRHRDGVHRPGQGQRAGQTRFSTDGLKTRGTNNNCANGYTPLGHLPHLRRELAQRVGRAAGDNAKRSAKEIVASQPLRPAGEPQEPLPLGHAGRTSCLPALDVLGHRRHAADDYRNIANTFGWVVEIDPFAPTSTPAKRTRWAASTTKAPGRHPPWSASRSSCTWATMRATSTSTSSSPKAKCGMPSRRQRRHGRGRQVPGQKARCTSPSSTPTAPAMAGAELRQERPRRQQRHLRLCRPGRRGDALPAWPPTPWAPPRWTAPSGTP
jgi:secreted PhoX family phosphatase